MQPVERESTPPVAGVPEVSRPTGWAGFGAVVLEALNRMTNERLLLIVVCALAGVVMWNVLSSQAEREARQYRHFESRDELMRQHCTNESKEMKTYFAERERERVKAEADRDERRMRFESEERAKDRVMLTSIVRELFGKKVTAEP